MAFTFGSFSSKGDAAPSFAPKDDVEPSPTNNALRDQLFAKAKDGKLVEALKDLKDDEKSALPALRDEEDRTLLWVAARDNDEASVDLLLAAGCKPFEVVQGGGLRSSKDGKTDISERGEYWCPFYYAVRRASESLVTKLLSAVPESERSRLLDFKSRLGFTFAHVAVAYTNVAFCQYLRSLGFSFVAPTPAFLAEAEEKKYHQHAQRFADSLLNFAASPEIATFLLDEVGGYHVDGKVSDVIPTFYGRFADTPLICAIKRYREKENEFDFPEFGEDSSFNLDLIKLYLARGASVKPTNGRLCHSALAVAVKQRLPIFFIELLLERGAHPNDPDTEGKASLYYAHSGDVIRRLGVSGADPNIGIQLPPSDDGDEDGHISDEESASQSPLVAAIVGYHESKEEQHSVIEALLDIGADPSVTNAMKRTPYEISASAVESDFDYSNGAQISENIALKLINMPIPESKMDTFLCHAANNRWEKVIEELLRRGATADCAFPTSNGETGRSALSSLASNMRKAFASEVDKSVSVARLLLRHGAKVDRPDCQGVTALHMAAMVNVPLPLIRVFVDEGLGDLTAKNIDNELPIHLLIKYQSDSAAIKGWFDMYVEKRIGGASLVPHLLEHVCAWGHAGVLRLIGGEHPSIYQSENLYYAAVCYGGKGVLKDFIECAGDEFCRTFRGAKGRSALHWVASYGIEDHRSSRCHKHSDVNAVLDMLVSVGLSPDVQDVDGKTALSLAALYYVGPLLRHSSLLASAHVPDNDGALPIHLLARHGLPSVYGEDPMAIFATLFDLTASKLPIATWITKSNRNIFYYLCDPLTARAPTGWTMMGGFGRAREREPHTLAAFLLSKFDLALLKARDAEGASPIHVATENILKSSTMENDLKEILTDLLPHVDQAEIISSRQKFVNAGLQSPAELFGHQGPVQEATVPAGFGYRGPTSQGFHLSDTKYIRHIGAHSEWPFGFKARNALVI